MFDLTKPKWIIQDNMLRLGNVVNHSDLASDEGGKVKGGGLWHLDREPIDNTLYLYAKSYGFGQVSEEDFKDLWVQPSLEKATIYFSTAMSLENAKKNNILIQDLNKGELL